VDLKTSRTEAKRKMETAVTLMLSGISTIMKMNKKRDSKLKLGDHPKTRNSTKWMCKMSTMMISKRI
jgi:hypothetical protein